MESFLDAHQMQEIFKKEVLNLPFPLQKSLAEWHSRLKLKGEEICELSQQANDAYEKYENALLEIINSMQPVPMKNIYTQLYEHLANDALLVAALFASLGNVSSNITIIQLNHWAKAQEFIEKQRGRYHQLTLQEGQKALALYQGSINKYRGRVRVKGYKVEDYPFFLWITLVLQTDDLEWHGIRTFAQRAYYPQDL